MVMRYDIDLKGKVLEIGGGNRPIFRPNIDIRKLDNVDIVHDLNRTPWPFGDEEFDGIYGGYILEHLSWRSIRRVVRELYRILRDGGKAIFLVPNTIEQCRKVVMAGEWRDEFSCLLFGDQDYGENSHACGFCPSFAKKLFAEAGFRVRTIAPMPDVYYKGIMLFPRCDTDFIIEAHKGSNFSSNTKVKVLTRGKNCTEKPKKHPFDREYFESDCQTRGYVYEGYRDFACHYKTAEIVYEYAKKHNCKKVLEVGAGRGYTSKILKAKGLDVTCLDISEHCYHTRVVENFILWDMTEIPWPFKNKEFDLCWSIATLEHIPEDKVDDVIKEMARVSSCGIHGIGTTSLPYDIDDSHCTIRPISWWQSKFEENCPDNYIYSLMDKEMMEASPYPIPPPDGLVKLNLGSFITMFYYGWINMDIIDLSDFAKKNGYIFKQLDVRNGLPFEDNSVDFIFSSHLIEHLSREEGLKLLKECHRVLKPNGVLRIATPDARKLMRDFLDEKIREYRHINKGVEKAETDLDALLELLWAGHKTIYDYESLGKLLSKAGFRKIQVMSPFRSSSKVLEDQTFVSHPTISLVVDAMK